MVSQMKFPKVSQKEAIIVLARGAAEPWLRVHGKLKRPEMTKKQALELRECFELIDSDGSGAIAADEVPLVFTVLGMDVKKHEIDAAVEEFNGEKPIMEYPQYIQMMLSMLDKIPSEYYGSTDSGKPKKGEYTLPFPFFAQAYRRRKLIEAVMGGDKSLQDRMNYRSIKAIQERQALRDLAAGKSTKPPKSSLNMTLEMTPREKKRARAATLKKPMYIPPKPEIKEPEVFSYVVDNAGPDVKELLLGEKRNEVIKAALDSEVKFVPPTNKSIEIDQPILSRDGSELS
ncbi:hypothetical protein KC19_7G137500 [Ceratodon purpureus]|uniref:EF-hand domain-containing protein n=1 Tax=Ceratodon purpureus TaxID=3225 RepID=A0A8T0H6A2_CERPU|nr:hypothetical protein KC19_7G137500 [Ceratodon purpureus]